MQSPEDGKSHRVAVLSQTMRLKIRGNHPTCKVANKCRMFVSGWKWWRRIKMVPSLPLLSCESSEFVKENLDTKKTLFQCFHC